MDRLLNCEEFINYIRSVTVTEFERKGLGFETIPKDDIVSLWEKFCQLDGTKTGVEKEKFYTNWVKALEYVDRKVKAERDNLP